MINRVFWDNIAENWTKEDTGQGIKPEDIPPIEDLDEDSIDEELDAILNDI